MQSTDRRVGAARDAFETALRMYRHKPTPSNAKRLALARDFMQRVNARRRRQMGGLR